MKVLLITIKHRWISGRITLASNNPLSPPNIWANDLAEPIDRAIIYDGIRKILKLSKAKALEKYGLKKINQNVPECAQYKKGSIKHWDCQIQYNTRPENHQAGTCKMGSTADPMAVVSSDLKVYGVNGLRVADASIMPQVNIAFFFFFRHYRETLLKMLRTIVSFFFH